MPGKIRLADKSTLFLDEIGELDDQNQAKLLRVIEPKEVFAVGGHRGMRCDVRFMAPTTRDVSPESDGPLRDDLFYRHCVGDVTVQPPHRRPRQIRKVVK